MSEKKNKVGRPSNGNKSQCLSIPPSFISYLKKRGNGSASRGAQALWEIIKTKKL